MAYRTTEHKKAIIKMVREKRLILQIDLAVRLNKKSINDSVKSLVEEGKLKRQKVKNRGKVGNLTDVWLVYDNKVRQQEILEFELTLLDKPYVSPLEINHCYKSVESPITAVTKIDKEEEIITQNNVVDLQEYIKINKQDIMVKDFKGNRVVTFKDIDAVHKRPNGTASRNFKNNRDRFIEGVDYFIVSKNQKDEFRLLEIPNRGLTLITETGYMMLVKSFSDDLSWDVQRQLVNSYFTVQEIKEKLENSVAITKENIDLSGIYDFMQMFSMITTDLNNRVKILEGTIESMKKAIMA